MSYIIFGIFLSLSIFIIFWKIKNFRLKDDATAETPKRKSFLKQLSEKIWEMEWEAAIPWFWICVIIVLIIWGLSLIHSWSSSERAYWAERIYWASKLDKIHLKTLARIQATSHSSFSTLRQSSSETLPTPDRVTVEKEGDSTWRIILPANQIAQTSISVQKGDHIHIRAAGLVKWNSYLPPTPPEGWRSSPRKEMSYPDSYFAPDIRAGALLVKIGERIFGVGREQTITTPSDGRLVFLINDQFGHLSGNTGSFEIRVTKL